MTEAAARAHIDRFNAAVSSGDWSALLATLHPDAVMTFEGPPAGPFAGRDAIATAYATDPPDDTMRVLEVRSQGASPEVTDNSSRQVLGDQAAKGPGPRTPPP